MGMDANLTTFLCHATGCDYTEQLEEPIFNKLARQLMSGINLKEFSLSELTAVAKCLYQYDGKFVSTEQAELFFYSGGNEKGKDNKRYD